MILKNKVAVVYGAGGSLGGAVARALAHAGATVFLTGRRTETIDKIADSILHAGAHAEADVVDAFDENAVALHLRHVIDKAGRIDITFNAVGVGVVQNIPLLEIDTKDFISPPSLMLQIRFITAKA